MAEDFSPTRPCRAVIVFSEAELAAALSATAAEPARSLVASRRPSCAMCGASLRKSLLARLVQQLRQAENRG